MNTTVYQLNAVYDSRASFYGKAQVITEGDVITLQSYDTRVATIQGDTLSLAGYYSPTTARHIRDFARQHGFRAPTCEEMKSCADILK